MAHAKCRSGGDWLMDEAVDDNPSVEAVGAAEKQVEGRVMALVKFLKSLQDNK